MLVNAVIYTFPAENAGEAAALLARLRDASRAEAGCIAYDVARGIEDANVFVLHEVWQDQAALDFHYATAHFQQLGTNGIRQLATSRIAHRCAPLP